MALRDDPHGYIDHSLTNHPPIGPEIVDRFEALRVPAKAFGHAIVDLCPPTAERTLAIRNLETAVNWAIKAIACNQEAPVEAAVSAELYGLVLDPGAEAAG